MKHTLAFIHGGGLFPMEVLAFTGALFLFLYIKKENFNIWFSFVAVILMALTVLSMACTVIGAVHGHKHKKHSHQGHGEYSFRGGMGMGRMGMGHMGMEGAGWGRSGMEGNWGEHRMHGEDGAGWGEHGSSRTPEERATAMSDKVAKDLSLNDDQKKKVYAAVLVREQKRKEVMDKGGDDPRAAMKPVADAFDASMKTILTPAQYTQWKADREKRMHPHQGEE